MKNFNIIQLYNVIQKEKSNGSVKFRYGLLRNESIIKSLIEPLMAVQLEMQKMLEPYKKDLNNLDKNDSDYMIKVNQLKEKYKDTIKLYDDKSKEWEQILSEDVDATKIFEISIDDVPQNIQTESMEILLFWGILK
ncbi:hypothetical protein [Clostridium felsineum]|uniref:Uncharacterized protein n=1 Tax=Clostridium felsineum TaxID=36839 RepID=A0A1S8KZX1_9CLOT|nr:hypothetical protein [Clostridium felsineum]URZ06494.1 hypothetical protein CLROS_018270 [Clostridium felsineum]URZ11529.1 hypothetical protein CROST_022460 [Clostridium felsineum]